MISTGCLKMLWWRGQKNSSSGSSRKSKGMAGQRSAIRINPTHTVHRKPLDTVPTTVGM